MLEGGTTMLPSSQGVCSEAQPGAPALGWYKEESSVGFEDLTPLGRILVMEVWWEYVADVTERSK